jgi:hypothetical protein
MKIANPSKAFIAFTALICVTVLRAVDRIDQATFNAIAGIIIGYATGNTMSARKREPVEPIIGPRDDG